jgi:hypothetical protein
MEGEFQLRIDGRGTVIKIVLPIGIINTNCKIKP